jgi:hypothetical protein
MRNNEAPAEQVALFRRLQRWRGQPSIDLRGGLELPGLSHEGFALLPVRKFFGLAFGLFRLLMPLLFDRYFASHGSLPEVLRQGFEVKKIMLPNLELSARFRTQEIVF